MAGHGGDDADAGTRRRRRPDHHGARRSRADDIAARQQRYLISMGIRTVCFVGAVVSASPALAALWVLIAAALSCRTSRW